MKPEAGQRVYWTKVSTNTKVRIGHIAKEDRQYHRPIAESGCRLREFRAKLVRRERPVQSSQSAARELGDGRHYVKGEDKSK
jgi:hypothetical protein